MGGGNFILVLKGRYLPQLFDNRGHLVDNMVDLRFGIEAAEAEPNRPVRHRERYAHRPQNMRRFERAGSAGRTG